MLFCYMKVLNLIIIVIVFLSSCLFSSFAAEPEELTTLKCTDDQTNCRFKVGYFFFDPYQYYNKQRTKLTGIDVEIIDAITNRLGISIDYEYIPWDQYHQDIMDGKYDILLGVSYTKFRSQIAYFSSPYRIEENVLFVRKKTKENLKFNKIEDFISYVRLKDFRLGVVKGFVYADTQLNFFIYNYMNKDIISYKDSIESSIDALIRGEVDGVVVDRVAGISSILKIEGASLLTKMVPLNIKKPVHFMFCPKTVPESVVEDFNRVIEEFILSKEYKKIIKNYFYPVFLMQILESYSFYLFMLIGVIAFSISAIVIAVLEKSPLLVAVVYAIIAILFGWIIKTIILNYKEVGIFVFPIDIYVSLLVIIIGFIILRSVGYYNQYLFQDSKKIEHVCRHIIFLSDALGSAFFSVVGVFFVIVLRLEPLEFTGPLMAFFVANGGLIIRDTIRGDGLRMLSFNRLSYYESSLLWGIIFSIYLDQKSLNPSSINIEGFATLMVIGNIVTICLFSYFNISNIKFIKR